MAQESQRLTDIVFEGVIRGSTGGDGDGDGDHIQVTLPNGQDGVLKTTKNGAVKYIVLDKS